MTERAATTHTLSSSFSCNEAQYNFPLSICLSLSDPLEDILEYLLLDRRVTCSDFRFDRALQQGTGQFGRSFLFRSSMQGIYIFLHSRFDLHCHKMQKIYIVCCSHGDPHMSRRVLEYKKLEVPYMERVEESSMNVHDEISVGV